MTTHNDGGGGVANNGAGGEVADDSTDGEVADDGADDWTRFVRGFFFICFLFCFMARWKMREGQKRNFKMYLRMDDDSTVGWL